MEYVKFNSVVVSIRQLRLEFGKDSSGLPRLIKLFFILIQRLSLPLFQL